MSLQEASMWKRSPASSITTSPTKSRLTFTESVGPEGPELEGNHSASSILQTNYPGIESFRRPASVSLKRNGLRRKGFAQIPEIEEEGVPQLVAAMEDLVALDLDPALDPDLAVAEGAPKAVDPEEDPAAQAIEIAAANRDAKNYLIPKGGP